MKAKIKFNNEKMETKKVNRKKNGIKKAVMRKKDKKKKMRGEKKTSMEKEWRMRKRRELRKRQVWFMSVELLCITPCSAAHHLPLPLRRVCVCGCGCVWNTLYCVCSLRKLCQGLDRDTDKDGGVGAVNHTHIVRPSLRLLPSTSRDHVVYFSPFPSRCWKLMHIYLQQITSERGWEEKDKKIWDRREREMRRKEWEGLQLVTKWGAEIEEWNWEGV